MWQRRDWEAAAIPWRQSVIAVVRVQPQRPKVKSSAAGTTSKCLCSMAKKKIHSAPGWWIRIRWRLGTAHFRLLKDSPEKLAKQEENTQSKAVISVLSIHI